MNSDEIREHMRERNDELPGEWIAAIGEGGAGHYTHWYYLDPEWQIEQYWDEGHPHTVNLYEVLGERDDGDLDVDEYPTRSGRFETREQAEAFVLDLMEEYQ